MVEPVRDDSAKDIDNVYSRVRDNNLPHISESDLPKVTDSDLPHISESDLPKVTDSDLPHISESDLRRVPEREATEGYKVVPVSGELTTQPGFAILDSQGSQVFLGMIDGSGNVDIRVPRILEEDDRIVSLARQCFDQMGEAVSIEPLDSKTLIMSSNPGILFKLQRYGEKGDVQAGYTSDMQITVDDYRLKQMPNPVRYLIPIISEIKGIPEKGVEDAFSKIQEVRRALPGHI